MSNSSVSRRNFVASLPISFLAGSRAIPCGTALGLGGGVEGGPQAQPAGFTGPLSRAEAAEVASSPMAGEISALMGKGYPCSEMILLSALRRFNLPENHLDAAAVFGGGVGKRDLCGLLTGGLMAIGILAGDKHEDRGRVHEVGRVASNAYWDWWLTRGDLHCMGPGTVHEGSEEFLRMCQRAALRLEKVMTEIA